MSGSFLNALWSGSGSPRATFVAVAHSTLEAGGLILAQKGDSVFDLRAFLRRFVRRLRGAAWFNRIHSILKSNELGFKVMLIKLGQRGSTFRTVIDVGASDGKWSRDVMKIFPLTNYLLFECDERHRDGITRFSESHPNVHVVMAAASDSTTPIYLHAPTPDSGKVSYTVCSESDVVVQTTTLDAEIARLQLPGPYFLKLDTHGFELPILRGASKTLENVELLQVEVYNFNFGSTDCVLRFPGMCTYLDEVGFRPLYLCDPLHRPSDGALFQFDLLFVRKDAPEFNFEGWR